MTNPPRSRSAAFPIDRRTEGPIAINASPQTLISQVDGAAGRLRLNRPKAIHALDLDMVLAMTASLIEWLHEPKVEAVIIDHAPAPDGDPKLSRGFCAGGDVVTIAKSTKGTGAAARAFFFNEYRLMGAPLALGAGGLYCVMAGANHS